MKGVVPLACGHLYHVYAKQQSHPLFANESDYAVFMQRYIATVEPAAVTYAYCLLPDHLHLLIRIRPLHAQPISSTARLTQLFEPLGVRLPFSVYIVEENPALLVPFLCYLHQNPALHGHCANFRDWRWSSYRAILSCGTTRIPRDEILTWFLGRDWFEDRHWETIHEAPISHLIKDEWHLPRP